MLKKKFRSKRPAHLYLTGNIEESFYQLGLHDKKSFPEVGKGIKSFTTFNFLPVDKVIDLVLKGISYNLLKKNLIYPELFKAYAKGLNISSLKFLQLSLIPELMTSLYKFLPKVPRSFLGCSSLFYFDEHKQQTLHGRILDYPLLKVYTNTERAILYDFANVPKIWSLSLSGVCYPSISAMNSEGISVALHMKYGNSFNLKGHFATEIIYKILRESKNEKDVIKILKHYPSLSNWGLYIGTQTGKVISVDLAGEKFDYKIQDLKGNQKFFYFNNLPIDNHKKENPASKFPIGNQNYCEMRTLAAKKKIEKKLSEKDKFTDYDLLEILGKPLIQKGQTSKNWHLDTSTITSLHTIVFNPTEGEISYVTGPPPKILGPNYLKIKNIWKSFPDIVYDETKSRKISTPLKYSEGLSYLAHASFAYDQKKIKTAYHDIQVAIECFSGHPEKYIAEFYFLVFQYIRSASTKNLKKLLEKFNQIKDKIPPYLCDHSLLFIARLEKRLNMKITVNPEDIKNESLRKIYLFEIKLPIFLLKKLRHFIMPNIGTLDIIYSYIIR